MLLGIPSGSHLVDITSDITKTLTFDNTLLGLCHLDTILCIIRLLCLLKFRSSEMLCKTGFKSFVFATSKKVLHSTSLLNQAFFWYKTDYRIVHCCLQRLYCIS